ncbi:MAG: hypothetical protein WBM32_03325 [Crocosphaera sp.]|jgi:hypothetical protein
MTKQLELFDISQVSSQDNEYSINFWEWEQEDDKSVFDNKANPPPKANQRNPGNIFDNRKNITELAVSEYRPGGTAGKTKTYFRFSYREKNRVKHIHIKGGNSKSQLARERKEKIELWILQPLPLKEIIRRIREW